MASLPTPRQLLTSLINSISDIPLAEAEQNDRRSTQKKMLNPLQLVSPSHRPLLTTLHVLFPTLVLPALDLLDRQLVTRVILNQTRPQAKANQVKTEDGKARDTQAKEEPPSSFYVVRSVPRPSRGRFAQGQSTGQSYIVHMDAWNCTCATFAFASFPAAVPEEGENGDVTEPAAEALAEDTAEGEDGWQLGGMSLDGIDGEDGVGDGVPCCKHILACLLAERWEVALGGFIIEERVGKEDMAAIIADV